MTILGIESSTPHASLALWRDGGVTWEAEFTSERAHNARIFAPLGEALALAGRKIDLVAVGVGPGSYGGVRVGIAVANGLSLALGAKTIGLSSLGSISGEPGYMVVGDARRQSFFVAEVRRSRLVAEPPLVDEADLADEVMGFKRSEIPVFTSDPSLANRFAGIRLAAPSARRLAEAAARMPSDEISAAAQAPLQPHYLRAPYITTPKR